MKWFFQSPTTPETVVVGSQYCGGSGVGGCRGQGAGRGGSLFCSCMRSSTPWPGDIPLAGPAGSPPGGRKGHLSGVWVRRLQGCMSSMAEGHSCVSFLPTEARSVLTWCCPQNKQALLVEGLHMPFWERKIPPNSPVGIPVTFPRLVFLYTVIYYPACFFHLLPVYG